MFLVRASSFKNFVVYISLEKSPGGVIVYRKTPNFELHTPVLC